MRPILNLCRRSKPPNSMNKRNPALPSALSPLLLLQLLEGSRPSSPGEHLAVSQGGVVRLEREDNRPCSSWRRLARRLRATRLKS